MTAVEGKVAKRILGDELHQRLATDFYAAYNLAERSLRILVVIRKISDGSRSTEGTKTRLTLASLLDTWAAHILNPHLQCLAALQHPPATAPP